MANSMFCYRSVHRFVQSGDDEDKKSELLKLALKSSRRNSQLSEQLSLSLLHVNEPPVNPYIETALPTHNPVPSSWNYSTFCEAGNIETSSSCKKTPMTSIVIKIFLSLRGQPREYCRGRNVPLS